MQVCGTKSALPSGLFHPVAHKLYVISRLSFVHKTKERTREHDEDGDEDSDKGELRERRCEEEV